MRAADTAGSSMARISRSTVPNKDSFNMDVSRSLEAAKNNFQLTFQVVGKLNPAIEIQNVEGQMRDLKNNGNTEILNATGIVNVIAVACKFLGQRWRSEQWHCAALAHRFGAGTGVVSNPVGPTFPHSNCSTWLQHCLFLPRLCFLAIPWDVVWDEAVYII